MPQDLSPRHTQEREQLRALHAVRPIASQEEGAPIAALPAGVFGFTTSPMAPDLPLFAQPLFRCTEVHKAADGEAYLLGYLELAEAAAMAAGAEPLAAELYPEPYEEAATLVAVPLSRIDRRRPPARDNGNPMHVEIAPQA